MMSMKWFLRGKEEGFDGLTVILNKCESKAVYTTDFVESIMLKFWPGVKDDIMKS